MQDLHVVMRRAIYAFILGGGAVAAIVSVQRMEPTSASVPFDVATQTMRWHERFTSKDADTAYADFLKEAGELSYDDAHTLSHIIGEELYAMRGDAGLSLCTQDFGFGCYHGFAGAAFSDRGLAAVEALGGPCALLEERGAYLGCIHGIGHGIFSFLGNDHLSEALDACVPVQRSESVGGCFGGVIMEYNYRTMQSPIGIELRPFDEAHAFEPCTLIAPEYRDACYFEQPAWWHASFASMGKGADAEIFKKSGALCAEVQHSDEKKHCFEGIGNVIGPRSGYDADVIRSWCASMPGTGAQNRCLVRALSHLLQSDTGGNELRAYCDAGIVTDDEVCGPHTI